MWLKETLHSGLKIWILFSCAKREFYSLAACACSLSIVLSLENKSKRKENSKRLVMTENAAVKTNNNTASICHLRKENHRQDLVPKKVYRTCPDQEMLPSPPTLPSRAGLKTKLFICVMAVYFNSHWLRHLACITAAGLHQVMGGTQATKLLWVKMNPTLFGCHFLCLLTLMMNDYLGWESSIYIYIFSKFLAHDNDFPAFWLVP